VDNYVVSIDGAGLSTTRSTGTATNTSFTGAQSGQPYTVTISPRNGADRNGTVVRWNSASATGSAIGRPGTPSLSATGDRSGSSTAVSLNASESDWAGGSQGWKIAKFAASTPIPSGCSTDGAERVWNSNTANDTITSPYRYVAYADNGLFCTASQPASVEGFQTPDAPSGSVDVDADGRNPQNYVLTATATSTGSTRYLYYSVNGGSPVRFDGSVALGAGSGNGVETSVVFTSCATDGDYCASSKPYTNTAYTTHATIVSAVEGQTPVVNPPDNSGNAAFPPSYKVEYCSRVLGVIANCTEDKADGGKYSLSDPVPSGFDVLRVTATVKGNADPRPDTRDITPANGNGDSDADGN
jgi:large repetitive protein